MNILPIIQARLTSTRLPYKSLMCLGNRNILQWQIDALLSIFDKLIIAIPDNELNEPLESFKSNNVTIYKGDENDVLKRILDAAKFYNIDFIIRICGDNPFIQKEFLLNIIDNAKKEKYDYISYYIDNINCITKAYGFFAEGFSYNKAIELYKQTNKFDREHVTPVFYKYNYNVKIKKIEIPEILKRYSFLRFTLDNDFDLDLFERIIKKYPQAYYTYNELIDIIDNDADIMNLMKENFKRGAK